MRDKRAKTGFELKLNQEIAHLLITNCDLRVLVAYPNPDTTAELQYLHSVISGNRGAAQFSQDESILIIFGYENGFEWEGMVYKSDQWKPLPLE